MRHNYSLPVGPDFGAGYQNTNRQYGRSCSELLQRATANEILGRNRNTAAQTNYDDLVWFWAKGLFVSDWCRRKYSMRISKHIWHASLGPESARHVAELLFSTRSGSFGSWTPFWGSSCRRASSSRRRPSSSLLCKTFNPYTKTLQRKLIFNFPWRERTDSAGWVRTSHASPMNCWSSFDYLGAKAHFHFP